MKVDKLEVTKVKARELYEAYRAHKGQQTPEDAEIESIYRLIGQGKTVIRAVESIKQAGLGIDKRPLLAIARADTRLCWWRANTQGGGDFLSGRDTWRGAASLRTHIGDGAFDRPVNWDEASRRGGKAMVPLIPVHIRPKHALSNYHILFEAEWSNVPPIDPILLRRVRGDAWLVLAAWDLTPVEIAAMANRVDA